jgi:hypothetical protein
MTDQTRQELSRQRGIDFICHASIDSIPDVETLNRALELEGEPAITMWLKWVLRQDLWEHVMAPVHVCMADTIIFNQSVRIGIADIVAYHVDGTATVIELKDGAQGFRNTVAGLGQAGLYAAQLDPNKALKKVRRALAWTPVRGHEGVNDIIQQAVIDAGAIPVRLPCHKESVKGVLRSYLESTVEAATQFMRERKVAS